MSEEPKEESKGIEEGSVKKGGVNEKPSDGRPDAPPKGQGGSLSEDKTKEPPKQKLCPLMGPGKHPCRPECSWSWVSPQDGRCVCSVSMIAAMMRDVAGPIARMFSPEFMPGPPRGPGADQAPED